MNDEFATIILSGVVFLGVGDVSAALYGQEYGKTKWYEGCKKSIEGSSALYISLLAVWIVITNVICPLSFSYYLCYIASSLIVMFTEAFTEQYDNLICTILYYVCLLQMIDMFNKI